ncbi:MAG: serine/threonine protein kinase [Candidatus Wallbacteria bacterium]|nr:serine/threonine protein kinase [Candidatus Wallbacteria bacterium]
MTATGSPLFQFTDEFLERYSIVRTLGQGAGGYVLEGRQNALNRTVAIKVLKQLAFQGEDARRRFLYEAKITALLHHPNIVEVYDFGFMGDVPYTVYEYISGETLRELLGRQGKLSPPEFMRIAHAILSGLGHAHEMGVVHRDMKPENVLMDREGRVKVADFGLAKGLVEREYQTAEGMVMGTLPYIAPELTRGEKATAAADLYATGIEFYEMIAGARPFDDPNPIVLLMKHQQQAPPGLAERALEFSPRICAAVMKALEKDPAARHATAGQFLAALDGALPEASPAAPGRRVSSGAGKRPSSPPRPATPRRAPARLLAGAGAGALGLLAFALLWRAEAPGAGEAAPPARVSAPAAQRPRPGSPFNSALALNQAQRCLEQRLEEGGKLGESPRWDDGDRVEEAIERFGRLWEEDADCVMMALGEEASLAGPAPDPERHTLGLLGSGLLAARTSLRGGLSNVAQKGKRHQHIWKGVFREDRVLDRALIAFDDRVARRAGRLAPILAKRVEGPADPCVSSGVACLFALTRPGLRGKELTDLQARVTALARYALPALASPAAANTETVHSVRQLLDALAIAGAVAERRVLMAQAFERMGGAAAARMPPAAEMIRSALALQRAFETSQTVPAAGEPDPEQAALADWVALRDRLLRNWPYDPRRGKPPAGTGDAAALHETFFSDLAVIRGQIQYLSGRTGKPLPPEH